MTGYPGFNYPAFFRAAEALAALGIESINPARAEGREGCKTWQDFMRLGLIDVANSDGVALLPGWQDSRGAALEAHVARSIDLPVRTVDEWLAEA
jgi:hypothetical protein